MTSINFNNKILLAPDDPAEWDAWRDELQAWRDRSRSELDYTGELYARPEFAWTQSCFTCCMAMLFDQEFYDPQAGSYRVDAFLDQGEQKFGGYDAIVLWHAYPLIGIDDRNQFDFYREAPGGLDGLREVCRICHARGVRVFVDYNPWDTGTRREEKPDLEVLTGLVREIGADGIFLDTMKQGSGEFRAALDAVRPGVALESEGMTPLDRIQDHHLSWGQWAADSRAPGVLRNKWFERRHMVHMIARWDRDRTEQIQTAWMNGAGVMIWENVFGSWVGWNARDAWLLRSILPVQRRYAALFTEGEWTPLSAQLGAACASRWENNGLRLWTVVNRGSQTTGSPPIHPDPGMRYYDLLRGVEIDAPGSGQGGVTVALPGLGCGAVLACPSEHVDSDFLGFLERQALTWAQSPRSRTFPHRAAKRHRSVQRWRLAQRRRSEMRPLQKAGTAGIETQAATVEAGRYTILQSYRYRECGMYGEPMYVNVWKPKPPDFHGLRFHSETVDLGAFAIDRRAVTNAQYQCFLRASGYQPRQPHNFLRHWVDGAPVPGTEDAPVVYVDLEDARAYAHWAGVRLPTEFEWQAGMERIPHRDDVCVWNWTESEHSDGRTRFCILKGGSETCASGSEWYADGGPQAPDFAAKCILFWPGLDRRATIGFRCVQDLFHESHRY